MTIHYPRILRILSYTVCDQIYRRSYCLIQVSSTKSGIITDTFWNPFENYEESSGNHLEIEEKFKKLFYELYSRNDVRDLWVSDFAAVLKYKNLTPQPYAFFEKRIITGTIVSIIHKYNKYPANTWLIGTRSEKVWIKLPWNIKGAQPGETVHIRAKDNTIQIVPMNAQVDIFKYRKKYLPKESDLK